MKIVPFERRSCGDPFRFVRRTGAGAFLDALSPNCSPNWRMLSRVRLRMRDRTIAVIVSFGIPAAIPTAKLGGRPKFPCGAIRQSP